MKRAIALTVVAATSMLAAGPSAGAAPARETTVGEYECNHQQFTVDEGVITTVSVCTKLSADGTFTAKVIANEKFFPEQTVLWYGRLQNREHVLRLTTAWVPLYSSWINSPDGNNEVAMEFTLQEFKTWSDAYGIGWTKIGVCMHPYRAEYLATREQRESFTKVCAPSIEVPELTK